MNFKPSDLFLGMIDFFGILIPGVVLFFFHGDLLMRSMGADIYKMGPSNYWIVLFFCSYISGHFLLGISVLLNKISVTKLDPVTLAYFDNVKKLVILPVKNPERKSKKREENEYKEIENVFYSAFSYLRMNSPAAMGELERQAAEYKLFRSLCLFFSVDIVLVVLDKAFNIIPGSFTYSRLGLSSVFLVLTFWRFDFLFDWTHRLAFDFFLQIQKTKVADKTEIGHS
jgi:hypothetical protein